MDKTFGKTVMTESDMKKQAHALLEEAGRALQVDDKFKAMEYLKAARILIEGLEHEDKVRKENSERLRQER